MSILLENRKSNSPAGGKKPKFAHTAKARQGKNHTRGGSAEGEKQKSARAKGGELVKNSDSLSLAPSGVKAECCQLLTSLPDGPYLESVRQALHLASIGLLPKGRIAEILELWAKGNGLDAAAILDATFEHMLRFETHYAAGVRAFVAKYSRTLLGHFLSACGEALGQESTLPQPVQHPQGTVATAAELL